VQQSTRRIWLEVSCVFSFGCLLSFWVIILHLRVAGKFYHIYLNISIFIFLFFVSLVIYFELKWLFAVLHGMFLTNELLLK